LSFLSRKVIINYSNNQAARTVTHYTNQYGHHGCIQLILQQLYRSRPANSAIVQHKTPIWQEKNGSCRIREESGMANKKKASVLEDKKPVKK